MVSFKQDNVYLHIANLTVVGSWEPNQVALETVSYQLELTHNAEKLFEKENNINIYSKSALE